jgi:ubiquinone/menaquinone biosynthesis C-methylase UbiE
MNLRRALHHFKQGLLALDPRKDASGRPRHAHAHPTYSEAELLARAEEFNRNAESHWQSMLRESDSRLHALNKPFSNVRDTPAMLYRLGLVLNELDLGVGMSVLDFGAGSCWVSSCINRLRCRSIALDVSATAMALGRELFATDTRQHMELDPLFIAYDGHAIPLPDASVDRALCFDSFHHVPNQDEVLGELHRVLKPGGRLVMAEPGEGHAHMDQSLVETQTFGVLENDLHMDELVARARRAGFDRFSVKPFPDADTFTFPLEDYSKFMDGDDALYPLQQIRNNLRHFYVVTMGKGAPSVDSRNPRRLLAEITPKGSARLTGVAAKQLRFRVRVANAGDTTWLAAVTPSGGYVMLGGHLLDEKGAVLQRGFLRAPLPCDLPPGGAAELDVAMYLPPDTGRYVLRLDMVDEFVAWFEACGSRALDLPLEVASYPTSRDPHRLAAEIRLLAGAPTAPVVPGSPLRLVLALRNTGDSTWLPGDPVAHGNVSLGVHLRDASGSEIARDYMRLPLTREVAPKETLELPAEIAAPPEAGRFKLQLDLVAEGVCWFEHMGSPPLSVALETNQETPDSLNPGLLRASIQTPDGDSVRAAASSEVQLRTRVSNLGNTLWRQGREQRGTVALGGHLFSQDALLELDFLRAALPKDVAPGESVELPLVFRAPERAGTYLLELDMVDEGIAWFEKRGSRTARVELVVA